MGFKQNYAEKNAICVPGPKFASFLSERGISGTEDADAFSLIMIICPSCNIANSPRSRFCVSCGGKLEPPANGTTELPAEDLPTLIEGEPTPPADPAPTIETPSEPSPAFVPSAGEVPSPPALAAPRPTVEPTSSVSTAETHVPADPAYEPKAEAKSLLSSEECPVLVSLNFNRVFIVENPSTFEVEIENESPHPIENVEMLFESSRAFGKAINLKFRRLAPGKISKKLVEIDPQRSGNFVLQGALVLETQGERFSFLATRGLRVNAVPDSSNISINISDIQSNRNSAPNAGLGLEQGDVHISNQVDVSKIQTLNDLIELELPDKFEPLDLELDYQLDLGSLTIASKGLKETVEIPHRFLLVSQPGTQLCLVPELDSNHTFTLVARRTFRLGRERQSVDFATHFWPRSPANDDRTKRVGRVHAIAEAANGVICMRDNSSANGASYGGVPLDSEAGQPLERRGTLALATEYTLDVLHFPSAFEKRPPSISNLRNWSGPEDEGSPRLGSVRFHPTSSEPTPHRSVWLLSDAAFGTSHSNPVILDAKGLAEIQGRFLFFRGCFWLENAIDNRGVSVDDHTLGGCNIIPLATGQRIRLGNVLYRTEIT